MLLSELSLPSSAPSPLLEQAQVNATHLVQLIEQTQLKTRRLIQRASEIKEQIRIQQEKGRQLQRLINYEYEIHDEEHGNVSDGASTDNDSDTDSNTPGWWKFLECLFPKLKFIREIE